MKTKNGVNQVIIAFILWSFQAFPKGLTCRWKSLTLRTLDVVLVVFAIHCLVFQFRKFYPCEVTFLTCKLLESSQIMVFIMLIINNGAFAITA